MKKSIKILLFTLLITIFLSACQSNDTSEKNNIFQFKDTLVGNNSGVGNIINQLPGADSIIDFELKTNESPYEIILNYEWLGSEQVYKKTIIQDATYLFTLVQNVDWIRFNSDMPEYTITKESLQEWYGKGLSDIETEDELIELMQEHLEDADKINQLLN